MCLTFIILATSDTTQLSFIGLRLYYDVLLPRKYDKETFRTITLRGPVYNIICWYSMVSFSMSFIANVLISSHFLAKLFFSYSCFETFSKILDLLHFLRLLVYHWESLCLHTQSSKRYVLVNFSLFFSCTDLKSRSNFFISQNNHLIRRFNPKRSWGNEIKSQVFVCRSLSCNLLHSLVRLNQ